MNTRCQDIDFAIQEREELPGGVVLHICELRSDLIVERAQRLSCLLRRAKTVNKIAALRLSVECPPLTG